MSNTQTDTPRTDHFTKRLRNLCDDEFVPIEFARQLERELVAVTEERDELKSKYRTHHDEAERITNEIRRVSSVCRKLKLELDAVESKYAKVVSVALDCNPAPAKDRADDELEPPWEVLARVKSERDRLAEALWSMLNQDDMSAIRAGILLRSLGLQSPTNPNEL